MASKFTVGKTYLTRDGATVRIVDDDGEMLTGILTAENGLKHAPRWTCEGEYCYANASFMDLLEPDPVVKPEGKNMNMIGKYCIVRTENAGVFAGVLISYHQGETVVSQARRIWMWEGAATLSQLAMDGTTAPENCKFPVEVTEIFLTQVIEIIPTSDKARESLEGVPIWKAK